MKTMRFLMTMITVFAAIPVFAGSVTCSSSTGDLKYQTYTQEGGPCCGGWSTTLTYKGQILKQASSRNGIAGNVSTTDSDPALNVNEQTRIDLGNSGEDGGYLFSNYAANLALSRTDGKAVLPDQGAASVLVSVVCTESHSKYPVP